MGRCDQRNTAILQAVFVRIATAGIFEFLGVQNDRCGGELVNHGDTRAAEQPGDKGGEENPPEHFRLPAQ
jgi:hypothetical protein